MKIKHSFLHILTGVDLADRRLPVMIADSEIPGPTVWITACMHGEEVGGIALVHDTFLYLKNKGMICGKVCAFPLLNPWGFESMTRNVYPTHEDLNRSFPGSAKGSLAQRIAKKVLYSIVKSKPELVIDLHHDWVQSVPYALLDHPNPDYKHNSWEVTKDNLKHCDMLQIMDSVPIKGSLTHTLLLQGIPAITLELGESYRINENQIRTGLNTVLKILHHYGIVESSNEDQQVEIHESCKNKLLEYIWGPVANNAGIIRYLVVPGQVVNKDQAIAEIFNSVGNKLSILYAPAHAVVLGYRDYAMVVPGMQVIAFGKIADN